MNKSILNYSHLGYFPGKQGKKNQILYKQAGNSIPVCFFKQYLNNY